MKYLLSFTIWLLSLNILPAQQTSKLIPQDCGATDVEFGQDLTVEHIPGAIKYEFKVENNSFTYSETVVKNNNKFKLRNLLVPITDHESYEVSVRVMQGNTYGAYGQKCNIEVNDHKLTALKIAYCNRIDIGPGDGLEATPVNGATRYEFNVENVSLGFSESIIKTTNTFNLEELSGNLQANTDYEVKIRTEKNLKWVDWGKICPIRTMNLASTSLLPAYCNKVGVQETDKLFFQPVPFTSSYQVTVTNSNQVEKLTVFNNYFQLSDLNTIAYQAGETYYISIISVKGNIYALTSVKCFVVTIAEKSLDHFPGSCTTGCNMVPNNYFENVSCGSISGMRNIDYDKMGSGYTENGCNVECWTIADYSPDIAVNVGGITPFIGSHFMHMLGRPATGGSPFGGEGVVTQLRPGNTVELGRTYVLSYHARTVKGTGTLSSGLAQSADNSFPNLSNNDPTSLGGWTSNIADRNISSGAWNEYSACFQADDNYDQLFFHVTAATPSGSNNQVSFGLDNVRLFQLAEAGPDICGNGYIGDLSCLGTSSRPFPVQYTWSPTTGLSNFNSNLPKALANPSVTTTYTLTAQYLDDQGNIICSDTDQVTVYVPETANFSISNTSVCEGEEICFNSATNSALTTYTWSINGAIDGTGSNICHTFSSSGNYTISLTVENDCGVITGSQYVPIFVNPLPEITGISTTDVTCYGANNGTASVSVTGGAPSYSYLWSSGGSGNNTVNGLTPKSHSVVVTDSKGCSDIALFSINEPTELSLTTSSTPVLCAGVANGTATVTTSGGTPGAGGYNYLWNTAAGSQTTATATGLSAGTYTVTVTDNKGCSKQASVSISDNSLALTVEVNTMDPCTNEYLLKIITSGGVSPYTFSLIDKNSNKVIGTGTYVAGHPVVTVWPTSPTIYRVEVTDANKCTVHYDVPSISPPLPCGGSNLTANTKNDMDNANKKLEIYPNPSTDGRFKLDIDFKNSLPTEIDVFDSQGNHILHKENVASNSIVDLSQYGRDTYMIKVKNGNEVIDERIVY